MAAVDLDKLAETHGEIAHAELSDGRVIVIRKPSRADFGRYMERITDDKASKAAAMTDFVMSCVVYPEVRDETKTIFDDFPGLLVSLATTGQGLAGTTVAVEVKRRR